MGVRYGTNASDTMYYFSVGEALTIYAYGGDDLVAGTDYSDQILGGDGNDNLWGGKGDDWIWGEDGADVILGDYGDDQLIGGADDDQLYGGRGNDWLWGESGNDYLRGDYGDDRLFGGAGDDEVFGDCGADELSGGTGDDYLSGGDGKDVLRGDDGLDSLYGGAGADRHEGGGGCDTFYFLPDTVTKTVSLGPVSFTYKTIETDTVTDFDAGGGEKLAFVHLLDRMTSFAGGSATDAIAQGYLYWVQHGQPGQAGFGTTVYIDRNGSAIDALNAPDLAIADLQGVAANQLNASHFIV